MLMNVLEPGQYCMYLRKSREDLEMELHGEGDTLLRHEKMLIQLAKKLNISIGEIYREIVSGESIDARPEVQRLIRDLEQHRWKGVLVVEVERLARGDTLDQGIVARAIAISGAKIITPLKIYDPRNESDMEYFEFGLFMSRREYATINRRIQSGRVASIMEGKWISPVAPYGYRRVKLPRDKGYTLEFEETEYEATSLIWNMYLYQRSGSYTISLELKARGFKNRDGKDFSPSSIREILHNIVYAGMVKWGERKEVKEIVDGKVVKRRISNPNPIIVKGLHPGYVTPDEFRLGQEIRKTRAICSNNFYVNNGELQNPLSGICVCKKCGHMMQRQIDGKTRRKDVVVYRLGCNTPACPNVSTDITLVEAAVLSALEAWTRQYELHPDLSGQKKPDTYEQDLARLQKELETLESQRDKLYDFLERGIYDDATFLTRSRKLADRIQEVQDATRKLTADHIEQQKEVDVDTLMQRVRHVKDAYSLAASAEEKNMLLKSVFKRIEYEKDEGGRGMENDFHLEFYPVTDFFNL